MRSLAVLLAAGLFGGCGVSSHTAQPPETCKGHGGVVRTERGEDENNHEIPMLVICRDGFLVQL